MMQDYKALIEALVDGLDIRLNHRVTKIAQRCNRVIISVEGGVNFVADVAIITVPLEVLKANLIEFEPKLPDWKIFAISDIGVGIENKVALLFSNAFWPNVKVLGVVAPSSYACGYFLNLYKATRNPILVYMVARSFVDDLEKLSDEEAVDFVMLQLKKILPQVSKLAQYLVSRWGSDIDSLGSYSCDLVGKPDDLYERFKAPVENLYFASEPSNLTSSRSQRFKEVPRKEITTIVRVPIQGIAPLKAAIHKLQSSSEQLMALHSNFLMLCLLSKFYKAATIILGDNIFDID